MEPEPGQSGGSGSTQIPRLRAAPAPKHCLVPVPYTIQVQGQGTGSNLWEKSMKNAITLCWAFRRSVKCYRYGTIPIYWSNTSNRIMFSKKGRKKCTLWRPNPCWAVITKGQTVRLTQSKDKEYEPEYFARRLVQFLQRAFSGHLQNISHEIRARERKRELQGEGCHIVYIFMKFNQHTVPVKVGTGTYLPLVVAFVKNLAATSIVYRYLPYILMQGAVIYKTQNSERKAMDTGTFYFLDLWWETERKATELSALRHKNGKERYGAFCSMTEKL